MGRRSPFGELLQYHRRQLGLSQEGLARRINQLADAGTAGVDGKVSAKTIYNHEAECDDPGEFAVPRIGTIGVYADAFHFAPGLPERQRLIDAAEETRRLKAAAQGSPVIEPEQRKAETPLPNQLQLSADFVINGREQAWARLRSALDATLAGQPQIVLLQGEAGIGKTRLMIELGRQAELAAPSLTVAFGRCLGVTSVQAVREVLALLLGDTAGTGCSQLVSAWSGARLRERAARALDAVVDAGPGLLGALISPELFAAQTELVAAASAASRERWENLLNHPEQVDQVTLHRQAVAMLQQYVADGPLVVILDDLHRATSGTLELLTLLSGVLRESTNLPLLLVGAFRSRGLAGRAVDDVPALVPILTEIQRLWDDPIIDLTPSLAPAAGRAYVDGRLDLGQNHLGAAFRDELFRKTGGLPLFVENALRTLHSRGQLRFDTDGSLVLSGELTGLDLPPTTRAIIGERMRDLGASARQALTVASVQGEQFIAEPVVAMLNLAPDAAAHLFDVELGERSQMLLPGGTVTAAGKRLHRYQFAHAVYREYLVERLGPLQREHHLRETAQALAAFIGPEQSELSATIADFYEQAGSRTDAAEYHMQAGTYELESQNPESAANHFERAIALADRQSQQELVGLATLELGLCLRKRGDYRAARHQCQSALKYGRAIESVNVESYALLSLGLLAFDLGELTTAETNLIEAMPMLRELGNARGESRAEGLLGHVLYGLGRYDEAIAHADRSLVVANRIGNEGLAAESRLAAANCLLDLGSYEAAITTFEEAIRRYQHHRDLRGEAVCLADIGLCQIDLGNWSAALDALGQAQIIGDKLLIVGLAPLVNLYRGLVFEARSEWRTAEHAYASALWQRRRAGQAGLAIDALAGLLRVKLARRQYWFVRRIVWGIGQWLEQHGAEGIEEPFRVVASCVPALEAVGQCQVGARLVRESVALLRERAAKIASPEYRTSYLYRVPANRALLERAAALGASIQ